LENENKKIKIEMNEKIQEISESKDSLEKDLEDRINELMK